MKKMFLLCLITCFIFHAKKSHAQVWEPLGLGIGNAGQVLCSAYDSVHHLLYVGGIFKYADGKEMNSIACYDGTNWFALGNGVTVGQSHGSIEQMAYMNGKIYVSGIFTNAGEVTCFSNFASWDGNKWESVPMRPQFKVLQIFPYDGRLFIGGYETGAYADLAKFVYTWNDTVLLNASSGTVGWYTNFCSTKWLDFAVNKGNLYISGTFKNFYLGKWNGSSWIPEWGLGGCSKYLVESYDDTLLVIHDNTISFLCHEELESYISTPKPVQQFCVMNDTFFFYGYDFFYYLEINGWVSAGLACCFVNPYPVISFLLPTELGLFAGGAMTTTDGQYTVGLSRFNGASWDSLTVFSYPIGDVNALAVDSVNNYLYAGGKFQVAGTKMVNNIARWDGSAWSGLSNGISFSGSTDHVKSLGYSNGNLYAFLSGYGYSNFSSLGLLGKWDGTSWSNCAPLNYPGDDEKMLLTNDTLLLCGGSAMEGRVNAQNGNCDWNFLGSTFNSKVYSMAKFNNQLIAGGRTGMLNGSNLALWNGSSWSALTNLGDTVQELLVHNDHLYASLYNGHVFRSSDAIEWMEIDSTQTYDLSSCFLNTAISFKSQLLVGDNCYNFITLVDTAWELLESNMSGIVKSLIMFDSSLIVAGHIYSGDVDNISAGVFKGDYDFPVADFVFNDTTICEGSIIAIHNQTSTPAYNINWTISPPAANNPDNLNSWYPTFLIDSSGVYTLTVIVKNSFGSDTLSKTASITIHERPFVSVTNQDTLCYGDTLILTAHGAENYFWGSGTRNVDSWTSPVIKYYPPYGSIGYLVGYDTLGCADTGSISFTILNPYFNFNLPGFPFICEGDTVLLSVSGNNLIYSWSPSYGLNTTLGDTAFASPGTSTTYTVTATDTVTGCSVSQEKQVDVNFYSPLAITALDSIICPQNPTFISTNGGYIYQWMFNGEIVPGQVDNTYGWTSETGMYGCIITSPACSVTDTVYFLLTSTPVINFTLGAVTDLCILAPVQSMPPATPGGGKYKIDNLVLNAIDPSWLGEGSHVLSYSVEDTFCCEQFISDTFSVYSSTVTLTFNNGTICIDLSPFLLEGGEPLGGTYSGFGVSSNFFDPGAAGIGNHLITYTFADSSGCMGSDSAFIFVDYCTGTIVKLHQLAIYPNPSTGKFRIALLNKANTYHMIIHDINGKTVFEGYYSSSAEVNQNIDLSSNLGNGIYFLQVNTIDHYFYSKLIIQKD